jgi:hypothetical protein
MGLAAFSLTGYGDQKVCPLPTWPGAWSWVGLGLSLIGVGVGFGARPRWGDERIGTKLAYVAVLFAGFAIFALSTNVCGPD